MALPTTRPTTEQATLHLEDIAEELRRAVYLASVRLFEQAEREHLIYGSGHYMAQELSQTAVRTLRDLAAHYEGLNRTEDPPRI